jgi:ABC-type maltose transport system permease subunit
MPARRRCTPHSWVGDVPIHRVELTLAGVIMVLPVALVFLLSQRFVTSGALIGSFKE